MSQTSPRHAQMISSRCLQVVPWGSPSDPHVVPMVCHDLVNRPIRWSLLFILGLVYWSCFQSQIQRNIVLCYSSHDLPYHRMHTRTNLEYKTIHCEMSSFSHYNPPKVLFSKRQQFNSDDAWWKGGCLAWTIVLSSFMVSFLQDGFRFLFPLSGWWQLHTSVSVKICCCHTVFQSISISLLVSASEASVIFQ